MQPYVAWILTLLTITLPFVVMDTTSQSKFTSMTHQSQVIQWQLF